MKTTKKAVFAVAALVGASVLAAGGALLNGCHDPAAAIPEQIGLCILTTFSTDIASGMNVESATLDTEHRCFGTSGNVNNQAAIRAELEASHAAEARLRAAATDGGAPDGGSR